MQYRAKVNVYCNGLQYDAGVLYDKKDIPAHLDLNDFELCEEESEEKPDEESKSEEGELPK